MIFTFIKWEVAKVVDTVPVPDVLASMYFIDTYTGIEMPTFHTSLNTGRFWALPANTSCIGRYRKKAFFFLVL